MNGYGNGTHEQRMSTDYLYKQECDARNERAAAVRAQRERFDPDLSRSPAEILRDDARAAAIAELGAGAEQSDILAFMVGWLSGQAVLYRDQRDGCRGLLDARITTP